MIADSQAYRPSDAARELRARTRTKAPIMPETGKPRARCRACRRYWTWGEPRIDGIFCSLVCAGIPEEQREELRDYEQYIRTRCECKTRTGSWKVIYPDEATAQVDRDALALQNLERIYQVYRCRKQFIHVGTISRS